MQTGLAMQMDKQSYRTNPSIGLLLMLFTFLHRLSISPSETVRVFDILSVFKSQNYNSFYNVQGDYPDLPA